MSQKKENKPCNGQFSKEAGQQKKGRKQNSGFGAGQEKGRRADRKINPLETWPRRFS